MPTLYAGSFVEVSLSATQTLIVSDGDGIAVVVGAGRPPIPRSLTIGGRFGPYGQPTRVQLTASRQLTYWMVDGPFADLTQNPSSGAIYGPDGDLDRMFRAQIKRVATRYLQNRDLSIARQIAFGDSFSAGVSASSYANSWAGRMAAAFPGIPQRNCGQNGAYENQYLGPGLDAAEYLGRETLTSSDVLMGMVGFNSLRAIGPDADKRRVHMAQVMGMLAWIGSAETQKIRANNRAGGANPRCTYTGAWNHSYTSPTQFTNLMSYSNTAGSSITFPPTPVGDVVYVVLGRSGFGDTLTSTINVDGVDMAQAGIGGYYIGSTYGLQAVRIAGLPRTQHIVKCTGSGSTTHPVFGVVCLDSETSSAPAVLAGLPVGLTTTGWQSLGLTANSSATAAVSGALAMLYDNGGLSWLQGDLRGLIDLMYSDGFNIAPVDLDRAWNPAIHVGVDNIHPTDNGYREIFRAFYAAASELLS